MVKIPQRSVHNLSDVLTSDWVQGSIQLVHDEQLLARNQGAILVWQVVDPLQMAAIRLKKVGHNKHRVSFLHRVQRVIGGRDARFTLGLRLFGSWLFN